MCTGAPDRIRTCDLRLRRPTLYPLSYRRASHDHTRSTWTDSSAPGSSAYLVAVAIDDRQHHSGSCGDGCARRIATVQMASDYWHGPTIEREVGRDDDRQPGARLRNDALSEVVQPEELAPFLVVERSIVVAQQDLRGRAYTSAHLGGTLAIRGGRRYKSTKIAAIFSRHCSMPPRERAATSADA